MKKTILLVEDEPQIVEIYQIALKAAGFEVESIIMGGDAIEKVKKIRSGQLKKPDLILLDLILPDINGLEVLQEIRKYEETKNLSVIILTNYGDAELEKNGYDLGIEQYLVKAQYTPTQLAALIKGMLK
jgi:two-component system alkaline phosphatase synthesis response regulator PhoP